MAISLLIGAADTAGLIVWGTLIHRLVPARLLDRVESFDWLVSVSLVPVSFALTGPVADAAGSDATLIGAGIIAGVVTGLFLFLHRHAPDGTRRSPRRGY